MNESMVRADDITSCRPCGGRIVWARAPNGKRVPVDYKPVLDGDVFFEGRDSEGVLRMMVLGPNDVLKEERPLRRKHIDGCAYLQRGWNIESPGRWPS